MALISLIIYAVLQVLFIPVAIVGMVLVGYKQMIVSKRLGISQTAIEVINGRWTMHIFGVRIDEPTARLAAVLPNTSLFGLWLALFPLWVKYRISGQLFLYPRVPARGGENLADLMVARTLYFDRVIGRVIAEVDQFVVLGAGYDTRCFGDLAREGLTCFEVDQPSVQEYKRKALAEAGISSDSVKFVTVDFRVESLFEKLKAAGYDPERKTLFLWEGVTLYLSEQEVRKTIAEVRDNAPAASVLLADIYADRMVALGKSKAVEKVMNYTDEGLGFSLPLGADHAEVLSDFLASTGVATGETFFMGSDNDKGPFMVVVEMKIG